MHDFATIIMAWPAPSIRNFADDIGVPYVNAQQMKLRNSIPDVYWDLVVAAAAKRGIDGITLERLQQLSARKRRPVGNAAGAVAA